MVEKRPIDPLLSGAKVAISTAKELMERPERRHLRGEDVGDFAVVSDEETERFVKSALSAAEKVAERRAMIQGEKRVEDAGEECPECGGAIIRVIETKPDNTCEETYKCFECNIPLHQGPTKCPD